MAIPLYAKPGIWPQLESCYRRLPAATHFGSEKIQLELINISSKCIALGNNSCQIFTNEYNVLCFTRNLSQDKRTNLI